MEKLEMEFYKEIKYVIDDSLELFEKTVSGEKTRYNDYLWTSAEKEYKLLQKSKLSKEQIKAIKEIMSDVCITIVHSLFVSIDGGTALSGEGKALELIDRKTGKPLTVGALHENFMEVFE